MSMQPHVNSFLVHYQLRNIACVKTPKPKTHGPKYATYTLATLQAPSTIVYSLKHSAYLNSNGGIMLPIHESRIFFSCVYSTDNTYARITTITFVDL